MRRLRTIPYMKRFRYFIFLFLIPLGAACVPVERVSPSPAPNASVTAPAAPAWEEIADGLWETVRPIPETEEGRIVMYRIDPDRAELRFGYATSPRTLNEWQKDLNADLVVNGTYFHEDYSPSGFLRTGGETVGERRFDLDQSGIIRLDAEPFLVNTARDQFSFESSDEVAQSYPFLFTGGKPALTRDTGNVAARSFIGTDNTYLYIGVIDHTLLSLYETMRVLGDQDIAWKEVLNLDGGPSSGIVVDVNSHRRLIESFGGVPNVIGVWMK